MHPFWYVIMWVIYSFRLLSQKHLWLCTTEYSVVFNGITSKHKDKKMYPSPRFVLNICELWQKKGPIVSVSMPKKPFILLREEWISSRCWPIRICVQRNNFQYGWKASAGIRVTDWLNDDGHWWITASCCSVRLPESFYWLTLENNKQSIFQRAKLNCKRNLTQSYLHFQDFHYKVKGTENCKKTEKIPSEAC